MARALRGLLGVGLSALSLAALVACGSRTGLLVEEEPDAAAGADAPVDTRSEEPVDAPLDVARDAPHDVTVDVLPDVFRGDCTDASATLVYLATQNPSAIYSFYPPTGAATLIGPLSCPGADTLQVFSMAVDRKGTADVLFYDPNDSTAPAPLYAVSTATAACKPLPYVPNQQGFNLYGMGYATNGGGPSEALYLMDALYFSPSAPSGLAKLDTTSFQLAYIGGNTLQGGELTGTGDGRLYSLFFFSMAGGFHLGEIDKATGHVLTDMPLNLGSGGFAIAFWGGDFYLFTSAATDTTVTRYRPSDQSLTMAADLAGLAVVGAGVSTCAPQ